MFKKCTLTCAAISGGSVGLYTFHERKKWVPLKQGLSAKVNKISLLLKVQKNGEEVTKQLLLEKNGLADLDDQIHQIPFPCRYLFELLDSDYPPMKKYPLLDHSENEDERAFVSLYPHSYNTQKEITFCKETDDEVISKIIFKRAKRNIEHISTVLSKTKRKIKKGEIRRIQKSEIPFALTEFSLVEKIVQQALPNLLAIGYTENCDYDITRLRALLRNGTYHWYQAEEKCLNMQKTLRSIKIHNDPEISGRLKALEFNEILSHLVQNGLDSYAASINTSFR